MSALRPKADIRQGDWNVRGATAVIPPFIRPRHDGGRNYIGHDPVDSSSMTQSQGYGELEVQVAVRAGVIGPLRLTGLRRLIC